MLGNLNIEAQFAVIMLSLYIIVIIHTKVHKCENVESGNGVCFTRSQNCWRLLNCTKRNISTPRLHCDNIEKVEVLYLDDNIIHYIDNSTFVGLSNLHTLSLQNNEINKIEYHTFRPLNKLKYLDLRNNFIEEIEENSFQNQTFILRIDLENNQLIRLNSGVFTNCDNLYQVFLTNNNIEEIMEDSFKENSNVQHLYCSHNRVYNLNFFKNLPKLRFLDLSYNKIEEIPNNTLLRMKDLKTLDLSHNKIEVLNSGTFSELSGLENLSLSNNMLKYLGEGPFDYLHKLDHLDLSNNFLETFSYYMIFEERNNITLYLYIDNNNWYCKFIHELKQLRWIKLRYDHVNKNISNIDGLPCLDRKKYSEKSTSTSSSSTTTSTSTTRSQPTTLVTQFTNPTTKNVDTTRFLNFSKTTSSSSTVEATLPRETTTSAVVKITQEPIYAVTTLAEVPINASQESNFRSIVTLPEVKINVSPYIIGVVSVIALLLITVTVSVTLIRKCSSRSYESESELSKDGYMLPVCPPTRRSNFYVTLESYNSYEEINEQDHIYEEIDITSL